MSFLEWYSRLSESFFGRSYHKTYSRQYEFVPDGYGILFLCTAYGGYYWGSGEWRCDSGHLILISLYFLTLPVSVLLARRLRRYSDLTLSFWGHVVSRALFDVGEVE